MAPRDGDNVTGRWTTWQLPEMIQQMKGQRQRQQRSCLMLLLFPFLLLFLLLWYVLLANVNKAEGLVLQDG